MIGLLLEGGGMRAGFVAGALMALMDRKLAVFDSALAVSASVPTLAYFASGQREEMELVWRYELNTPHLVCYRNIPAASLALSTKRPVLNLDYLIEEVFRKKYPLNMTRLLGSRTSALFALTQMPEGKLAVLKPGDDDIYCIFKAAMAVPGCYPGTVALKGGREYLDGGTVDPIPADVLLSTGVDRLVAVLSTPLDCPHEPLGLFERALFWRYFQRYDWMLEMLREAAKRSNHQVARMQALARLRPPRVFLIHPQHMPPARFITRDRAKIQRTIDQGYRRVEELAGDIERFLRPWSETEETTAQRMFPYPAPGHRQRIKPATSATA